MKIFEFLAIFNFLLAGAAGEDSIATAFVLAIASFVCGWLAIPKKRRKRR